MLVMGSLAPMSLFASDSGGFSSSCCSDIVNAINNSASTLGGKLDTIDKDSNTQLTQSNLFLGNIWNYLNTDFSRQQATAALINFQAGEIFRKYQYDQQLLYQVAPGSDDAITAGVTIGQATLTATALAFNNVNLASHYGVLSAASQINISGTTVSVQTAVQNADPINLYNTMQSFFTQGDISNFNLVNPAVLIYSPNLTKANISSTQAQQIVTILTDPFPTPVPDDVKAKLAFGGLGLTGSQKENLIEQMGYGAVMGLSTSAFGDIVARRTPATSGGNSVMETMTNYSNQRFTDPEWYKALGASSDSAILRELAHMQAYSIWVQNQQFHVEEQQMALMASMNAMMAKINITMNQMIKQLQLATAQAQTYAAQAQQQTSQANANSNANNNNSGGSSSGGSSGQ